MGKININEIYTIIYCVIMFFVTLKCILNEFKYSLNELYPNGYIGPRFYTVNANYMRNLGYNILFLLFMFFILYFLNYIFAMVYVINMLILSYYLDDKTNVNCASHITEKTPLFIKMILFASFYLIFQKRLSTLRRISHINFALEYYNNEIDHDLISTPTKKEYKLRRIQYLREIKLIQINNKIKRRKLISFFKK